LLRLEPVLAHSARAITLAHRAPLISTTPHGATRMAERARLLDVVVNSSCG